MPQTPRCRRGRASERFICRTRCEPVKWQGGCVDEKGQRRAHFRDHMLPVAAVRVVFLPAAAICYRPDARLGRAGLRYLHDVAAPLRRPRLSLHSAARSCHASLHLQFDSIASTAPRQTATSQGTTGGFALAPCKSSVLPETSPVSR